VVMRCRMSAKLVEVVRLNGSRAGCHDWFSSRRPVGGEVFYLDSPFIEPTNQASDRNCQKPAAILLPYRYALLQFLEPVENHVGLQPGILMVIALRRQHHEKFSILHDVKVARKVGGLHDGGNGKRRWLSKRENGLGADVDGEELRIRKI